MSRCWPFQDSRQKKKLGAKAPWSVGWLDAEGKRKSKRVGSKSMAEKYARKLEGQLAAGLYQAESRKSWNDFRAEYEEKIADGMEPGTRELTLIAVNHFERICRPRQVSAIKSQTIDRFIAVRRKEPGLRRGDLLSVATVNRDLRHLRAVLRIACDWKYLPELPRSRMLREPSKLPTFVAAEHFAAIYQACDVATRPKADHYAPAAWWRAFLIFQYMTGWRVSEPSALRWDDVSLDEGYAVTRHRDNKGKRDERVPLHSVVVEHLRKIADPFSPLVFPWPHDKRTLYEDFARIQEAAGIHLPCHEDHEHSAACHRYGFHDLRRAFATQNAGRLSADALQKLMRHRSYVTTQRYINMASQLDEAVEALHVPDFLRKPR